MLENVALPVTAIVFENVALPVTVDVLATVIAALTATVVALTVIFCVPAAVIPTVAVADLNKPVSVLPVNATAGAAAVPAGTNRLLDTTTLFELVLATKASLQYSAELPTL